MKKALFLMMCLCFSISVLAQAKTVTGTVVDAIGEPIIGASVLEMGTTNGTITDVDGNFTLAQFENLGELVKNTIFVA